MARTKIVLEGTLRVLHGYDYDAVEIGDQLVAEAIIKQYGVGEPIGYDDQYPGTYRIMVKPVGAVVEATDDDDLRRDMDEWERVVRDCPHAESKRPCVQELQRILLKKGSTTGRCDDSRKDT